jgi:hypothetical protein
MVDRGQQLINVLIDLWSIPAPGPANLLTAPAFQNLGELCNLIYGLENTSFSLYKVLRSLGLPCLQPGKIDQPEYDFTEIAKNLAIAFTRQTTHRRYICPLDLADELPPMAFGNARVKKFTSDELKSLFDTQRLNRYYPSLKIDFNQYAQFQWLIVEEEVTVVTKPEVRAVPFFGLDLSRDFGEINPYLGRFPKAVEDALFFLLLVPWENMTNYSDLDWRGFRIPWIYTLDEDLFVSPQLPPLPESLTHETRIVYDSFGEEMEVELPTVLPLKSTDELKEITNHYWEEVQFARKSVLFETPIAHFLIRGFLTDGIDEFIAHLTVIEAAVGTEHDHKRNLRPGSDPKPKLGATDRVARRLSALIGDAAAGQDYKELFDIRSAFIHGRTHVGCIASKKRVLARILARRAVISLVQLALKPISNRNDCLYELLAKGG